MLTSCLISVTNDSIEHRNLLAHSVDSLDKNSGNCLCQACSPPAKFGIERRGHFEKEHVAACARECWRWNYNMCRFMLIYKRLQIPIFFKKKNSLHITPRSAVKIDNFWLKNINDFHDMCYFVWENKKKIEKEHVAAGCWSWSNKKPKKGWLSTFAVSCER